MVSIVGRKKKKNNNNVRPREHWRLKGEGARLDDVRLTWRQICYVDFSKVGRRMIKLKRKKKKNGNIFIRFKKKKDYFIFL